MTRITYNKLVRDNIQAKIESNGETCSVRVITHDSEYESALRAKLTEEAGELAASTNRADFLAEYCDLMVVLDALTQLHGYSEADIRVAMTENVEKKGLFKNRHYLEWADDG